MRSARLLALTLLAAAACGAPDDRLPSVSDQRVATAEDTPVTFRLAASDPDGDPLCWTATPPAHGTLAIDGDLATYTPAPDFAGTDLVDVLVSDGERAAHAYLLLDVAPVADAPRAQPDTFPAGEDEPMYLATYALVANDVDPDGDRLHVASVAPISGGAITLADPEEVVFTPTPDYTGLARFTYTVSDGTHETLGQVVLRIGATEDAPRLTGDVVTTDEDTALTISAAELLRNDVDPDGDSLVLLELDDVSGGTAELLESGGVRFVPAPDFHGTGGFFYRAGDGRLDAQARVTVAVGSVDDLPVPGRLSLAVLEDQPVTIPTAILRERATDGDGDPLLVTAVDRPLQGSVVLAGDGVRFVPMPEATGEAGFRYLVSDGAHESDGWVHITLTAVDDPPVAFGQAHALRADQTMPVILGGRDVDSAPLVPEVIAPPKHGALVATEDGGTSYVPAPDFTGEDELWFVVHAGGLTSTPARVAFVVEAAPSP